MMGMKKCDWCDAISIKYSYQLYRFGWKMHKDKRNSPFYACPKHHKEFEERILGLKKIKK